MRVVVTVVDDLVGRSGDVLVDAPGDTPMERIFEALGREWGAVPREAVDVDHGVTFATSGLLDGTGCTSARRPRRPGRPASSNCARWAGATAGASSP